MAFQFSLATVLRVRIIREEREERMLQQILHRISLTLQSMREIDEQMEQANRSRALEFFKPVAGRQVHNAYGEISYLRQSRKDLEQQIEQLEQLKEKQFVIYEAARRDREMLTDMHEKKRDLYDFEMARREQKTLDDNFVARRGRGQHQA
jgi:flagellar export protein FliJ